MTSRPSRSGRPRSRRTTSGWRAAASISPSSRGRRPRAGGSRGAPSAGAQEAAHLRLVLDEDDHGRGRRRGRARDRLSHRSSLGIGGASFTGSVKRTARRRRRARFSAQMRPPCAVTIASADREAEPGAPLASRRPRPGRTSRRCAAPRPAGRPGPRSATSISTAPPASAARHLDRAPGRRVLERVLEQVDQHLLDQHVVHRHERQVGGARGVVTARRARALPKRPSAAPTTSSTGCHSFWTLQRARLEARHVEQVAAPGGPAARPPRAIVSSRSRRVPASRCRLVLEQGARRAGDRGERRAQVVRDRAQQRVAQPLGLGAHLRLLRVLGEPRALDAPARSGWRRSRAGGAAPAPAAARGSSGRSPSTPTRAARAGRAAGRARRRPAACRCPCPATCPCS